jgi:transcription elongation GreA/GreB family factor
LEILLKRDLPENYKTADVKKILKGIVPDQDIETFIEYLKKNKPKIKRQVSCDLITIDYSTLPSLSIEQIIELINSAASITRQKLVQTIKEKRQDWQEIYLQIFFIQTDKRVLQIVFTESDQKHQNYLVDKAFVEYKRYPVQFLFFAEISNQDPYAIITRYLDLAQVANLKFEKTSLVSEIHKRLISNNYALVRRSVTEITSDIAKRILVRIGEIKNLYPEERDIITNIIKLEFPELFETKDEYIYNTKTAINNKELELNKILNEAIPQVASEIGRARSYGDLRENFEFKAALAKQKRLISKVSEIRQELSKARPIDFSKIVTDKVNIGTTVTLLPLIENSQPVSYTILGPWDSDLQKEIISYLAPFAQNLLNKQVGEEIIDDEGKRYKITEISKEVSNEISNS